MRVAVLLSVIAILAATMSGAAAAGSGGWNPLGHGKAVTDPALTSKVGIYNATGAMPTKSQTVHRGKAGTFSITLANDGSWEPVRHGPSRRR